MFLSFIVVVCFLITFFFFFTDDLKRVFVTINCINIKSFKSNALMGRFITKPLSTVKPIDLSLKFRKTIPYCSLFYKILAAGEVSFGV